MKSDLDSLMHARGLDALLVFGDAQHNAPMYYLTGGGHVNNAILIKKRGEDAVLIHNDMEREEAAKSGLKTLPYSRYPLKTFLEETEGDSTLLSARRLKSMLRDCGIEKGNVGIYGHTELSTAFGILSTLQKDAPEYTFIGEPASDSVFLRAMETKDESEVARIRKMGAITTEVVARTAEFLTSHKTNAEEILIKEDGTPLRIGEVKAKINLWLAELGAENPEGTIFALGRDAGIPHSTGTPTDALRLGKTIVFDIFPCEAGGGYFYDFTRTWCLGYAPDAEAALYEEVRAAYEDIISRLEPATPFKTYQRMVCERFEANGHPTPLHTDAPTEGYVHSLGHGLGINIHERPWAGLTASDDNRLRAGTVFTIEPGLYYPSKGMGVRIENTYWARPDGKFEMLADFPFDLVLKMKS